MTHPTPATSRTERRAALVAVVVGALLMGAKFWAYALTGSSVVFSDAMESIANVVASGVAFYALVLAHRPADANHPYGHGKAEFVSAAFEGGLIIAASVLILAKAIDQAFVREHPITVGTLSLALLGATVVINGGLGFWLLRLSKRTGSMTLHADGKHLVSDAWTSIGTIAAVVLVRVTGQAWLDAAIAAGFGVYVGWQGVLLVRRALGGLTDEQDAKDSAALEALLARHVGPHAAEPRVCSFHKVRHRHSGRYHWVDFHIQLPAAMSVAEGHAIATHLEREMEQMLGEGDATAHIEPCAGAVCWRCGPRAS